MWHGSPLIWHGSPLIWHGLAPNGRYGHSPDADLLGFDHIAMAWATVVRAASRLKGGALIWHDAPLIRHGSPLIWQVRCITLEGWSRVLALLSTALDGALVAPLFVLSLVIFGGALSPDCAR